MAKPPQPIRRQAGQTVDDMAEQLAQVETRLTRTSPGAEHTELVRKRAISDAVAAQIGVLQNVRRIDLYNTAVVKEAASDYLSACCKAGTIPSILGLSAALGLSRNAVYKFLRSNPDHETSRFIETLQSSIAAIIAELSLNRRISEATSIFLLKNSGQGLTDQQQVEVVTPSNPMMPADTDVETIRQRYLMSLPPLDDPDDSDQYT